tara:strand:+ start:7791 stop:8015 length:225 start_codon:yes stop_codon:yes gene_type:complete
MIFLSNVIRPYCGALLQVATRKEIVLTGIFAFRGRRQIKSVRLIVFCGKNKIKPRWVADANFIPKNGDISAASL